MSEQNHQSIPPELRNRLANIHKKLVQIENRLSDTWGAGIFLFVFLIWLRGCK